MNSMIQKLPEIEDGRQWWLAFNVADDDDLIRRAFEARFGYPPREIVKTGGSKNVGPIEIHEAM